MRSQLLVALCNGKRNLSHDTLKYTYYGEKLFEILLNEHLGTRNVTVSRLVMQRYADLHSTDKDYVEYLYSKICAVDLHKGRTAARGMVKKILEGPEGVANFYLDAISNNEI
ncbi:hypothetical protein DASB73_021250 [Starmerella bacillaris]|uniref:Uncharacterized protein n=1 Tax=Starmerella bacillaris TaxID=1247836 RepID=A0AAV5RIY2_STABA|nr:hypothetical protein DASB73_021250 [Starmerella bacillaris]